MNIAWDAFRILDNHSKSMIFMMPDDTNSEEYKLYLKSVQKPISLETIRVSQIIEVNHTLRTLYSLLGINLC
jgi:hypothetical protein